MNDRDAINQRVLKGMVQHVKIEEADRLNELGVDAQITYLLTHYTVGDLLQVFANPIDPSKRESAALVAIDKAAKAPPSAIQTLVYADYTIDELLEDFKYVPEIRALLEQLVNVLGRVDAMTVECKVCHSTVSSSTAHAYEDGFIGDECCWDERLRTTE